MLKLVHFNNYAINNALNFYIVYSVLYDEIIARYYLVTFRELTSNYFKTHNNKTGNNKNTYVVVYLFIYLT